MAPAATKPVSSSAKASEPYASTEKESEAAQRLLERRKGRTPAARFKVKVEHGSTDISPDHVDPTCGVVLMCDAFQTGNTDFANGLLVQVANVARAGKDLTAKELNFAVAAIHEIAPRDPTEALLASQMVAIHAATMVAARRLNHVETLPQQDSASNMLSKLARTFVMQIEALKRYRATGEQVVKVQHVNVNAAQAVVGIHQGGGGTHESASQSHALDATPGKASPPDAGSPALLGHQQAVGMPMPCSSRERPACVPDARGAGGRTQG